MAPYGIENLDSEVPVGVLGHNGWRYITMGPDNHPNAQTNDGWGTVIPLYYMGVSSAATTAVTTSFLS